MKAVLFDLDNTLLLEDEVTERAYQTAAAFASAQRALDARALAGAAQDEADRFWRASPTFAHGDAIGISAGEAMWGDFADTDRDLEALHAFSLRFRIEVWSAALARCGVVDRSLVPLVAQAFVNARRAAQLVDPDANAVLATLVERYRLGIVTNGASRVQREKLAGSGLADRFGAVTVSAEVGHGKPRPELVRAALGALGVAPAEAVMVGDSIERDVAAARAAGVYAVWLDRDGRDRDGRDREGRERDGREGGNVAPKGSVPDGLAPDARITSLRELPALLDALP